MNLRSRLWQKAMIGLATNRRMKDAMQQWATASRLASRYVGGGTVEEGVRVAVNLHTDGIKPSLFYLGEYLHDRVAIEETVAKKICAAQLLGKGDLDVHVSVDPTQLGLSIDRDLCERNAIRIAEAVGASCQRSNGTHCMMLDMEDDELVTATIEVHDLIQQQGLPVAITLQAYLRRTKDDLQTKVQQGAKVRLVKGAFAANSDIAYTSSRSIRKNYLALSEIALSNEARETGFYASFATHDHILLKEIVRMAAARGWEPGTYEFEMLYGVRSQLAEQLAADGQKVRVYMPFGTDWWPYALRRLGESPKNLLLLVRAILSRA